MSIIIDLSKNFLTTRLISAAMALLIPSSICFSLVSNQPGNNVESSTRHYQGFGQDSAAMSIAERTSVVIGFEAVRPVEWSGYDFTFSGGAIQSLLDLYVAQFPGYSWKQVDPGVFRIIRSKHGVSLADQSISFAGVAGKTREQVWVEIKTIPEVKIWMSSHHCTPLDFFENNETKKHDTSITIKPGVYTLAQLLDQVALKSGVHYWSITESSINQPCAVSISIP